MKPRYVAALALVGWYLITPPFNYANGRFEFKFETPLKDWNQQRAFDSAEDCEGVIDDASRKLKNTKPGAEQVILGPMAAGQCIATDDPRLAKRSR